jgi:hypothetical protein
VRQSLASKDVNMEPKEGTALKAITRKQPVETQKTEKNLVHAVVNGRLCELAVVLQLSVAVFCKSSINPITNLNRIYSHSYT